MTDEMQLKATESLELSKNAKGQYSWTIKIRDDLDIKSQLERLEEINKYLIEKHKNEVQDDGY